MAVSSQVTAVVLILLFEAFFCFMFAFFVEYDESASSRKPGKPKPDSNSTTSEPPIEWDFTSYGIFMDVQMMIFVGFGFITTFLKKYGFSAVGFSFLVSVLVIQVELLSRGIYEAKDEKIIISVNTLIKGEVAAAAILISFGAVLGKISVSQLVFLAFVETFFYDLNQYINNDILKAVDAGGALYVHVFGAYFGLAVSFILSQRVPDENEDNGLRGSSYQSDIFAMIGTIFLWVCWPSFLASLQTGDSRWRTVINTYLALLTSCAVTFALSALFNKEWKFEMGHIQNATLAGGVGVGTVCNMVVDPFGAAIIGAVSAFICIIGFKYIQGFMRRKLHVDDVCGVHNLHAMPGIAAGLVGALMAGISTKDIYGDSLVTVFPAMGPPDNRGPGAQAGIQMALIGITMGLAIVGGLLTGVFLAYVFKPLKPEQFYDDIFFVTPESKPE